MTKLVIPESLRLKLQSSADHVEICDEQGRVLGYFLPAEIYERMLYASVELPITHEELLRRVAEPGGRSLAEIIADLEKR